MNPVYDVVRDLITDVEKTQQENIEAAAVACAKAIENGGILKMNI